MIKIWIIVFIDANKLIKNASKNRKKIFHYINLKLQVKNIKLNLKKKWKKSFFIFLNDYSYINNNNALKTTTTTTQNIFT